MRGFDIDRERCERKLTIGQFERMYNDGLPDEYQHVSLTLLRTFAKSHPELFKGDAGWSLDQHRKRVMDWLPSHARATAREE